MRGRGQAARAVPGFVLRHHIMHIETRLARQTRHNIDENSQKNYKLYTINYINYINYINDINK